MKKIALILILLLVSPLVFAEEAPDSFDRYPIPKESIVDPFVRTDECMVNHSGVSPYCYETITCQPGSYVVDEYAVLLEAYFDDTEQRLRVKILWWEYVIAGEVYKFELKAGEYQRVK